jgi:hypothetical protein
MRLDILNRGYGPGTKLLFALIRLFSGHLVPDAAKLVFCRPDFYGSRAKEFTMRRCAGLPPVGSRPGGDGGLRVQGERVRVLHRRAPRPHGRHTRTGQRSRRCWPTWNRPRRGAAPGNAADARQADRRRKGGRRGHAASAVRRRLTQQVEYALAVCAAFNTAHRLADAFGFEVLSPEGFEAGAKYLIKQGYR